MNIDNALSALSALGHATRLAAFRHLVQAAPNGMSVGELRELLDVPPATLSAHLNILRAAELVSDERQSRVIRVRANYPQMDALMAYLTENCCAGPEDCCPDPSSPSRKNQGASR